MVKKILMLNILIGVLLVSAQVAVFAQGSSGPTEFGGELRGITRVKGKIVCTACTLKEAIDANPDLQTKLYEFRNGAEPAVFQLTGLNQVGGIDDPSEVARWSAIVGQRRQLTVRIPSAQWKQLTAEENLQRELELTTLLRNTGVLDVSQLTYLNFAQ